MAWTSPRTWVASEVPPASTWNTHVRDNFKAIGDAWASYTPTWGATTTNPTLGNGTLVGAYLQAGKLVHFRITIIFGTTTTVGSGIYTFTAPVAARVVAYQPAGTAQVTDASVPATVPRGASFNNSATQITLQDTGGVYVQHNSPYAWAAGDQIIITGTYEAA